MENKRTASVDILSLLFYIFPLKSCDEIICRCILELLKRDVQVQVMGLILYRYLIPSYQPEISFQSHQDKVKAGKGGSRN